MYDKESIGMKKGRGRGGRVMDEWKMKFFELSPLFASSSSPAPKPV